MAVQEFLAARREATGEPIPFIVAGETFNLAPRVPAMSLLDLASMDAANDRGNIFAALASLRDFLGAVIAPDDLERFEAHMRRERVEFDELQEITFWIVAQVLGRPTEPPSHSPGRPSANGRTSKRGSSGRATPKKKSRG